MERAAISASGNFRFRRARLRQCVVAVNADVRMKFAVPALDFTQYRLSEFNGRDIARLDAVCQRQQRRVDQFSHRPHAPSA